MGLVQIPEKAVLISGILAADERMLETARSELEQTVGQIERVSDIWPFTLSQYYEEEIGPVILRQFVGFAEPFDMSDLVRVKLATNDLERKIARREASPDRSRPVNLDPGYVHLGALVLATTKERAHRIYLGEGIFADLTLSYQSGGWHVWPWTYPDFAEPTYHGFLSQMRDRLKARRRNR